ncbi:MAG: aminomethyltransferase family protein [Anaerolineales bacterium]|nr:MAG: aminomethyltransferase family protein [Anaerolineales bacterium]
MAITTDPANTAYRAALEGKVFFRVKDPGVLRFEGPDQSPFLQRQSTNDIHLLTPDRALVSVLVNANARILDVLTLFQEGSGLNALTLPGYAASTAHFLRSRIFFMDKVSLQELSQDFVQFELEGPKAGELLHELGFDHTPVLDESITTMFHDGHLRVIGRRGFLGTGYLLLASADQAGELLAALHSYEVAELTPDIHEVLRVESGIPGAESELNNQYTPLETGLTWAVATEKGCFTGQEIIARQITYDKVTQHLVGLQLEALLPQGEKLWVEGKPVGTVTSVVSSPTFGPIALGVVKRPYHEPGTPLSTDAKSDVSGAQATVTSLPFRPHALP